MVWRSVDDLSTAAPDARVMRVDRARARIEFGDGLTGRQPVLADGAEPLPPPIDLSDAVVDGEPIAIVEYLVGGGVDGELGADQAWIAAAGAIGWEASSPVAATGGAEAELLADARTRAAAELRATQRAVTRRDYQELARTTAGAAIARAFAAIGDHPGHPCRAVPGATTVYVVPHAPRDEDAPPGSDLVRVSAPIPDADSLALVHARLDRARLAGHEVFVAPPRYRAARLRFQIESDPRSPAALEARVRGALERYLDPLHGGDDETGWPFGEPLRPSALIRAAQAAVSREGEVRSVAIALDGAAPLEVSCTDVAIGAVGLPRLDAVAIDLLPRTRTREVLR
jgi:predicted phage baseplate assembly protein